MSGEKLAALELENRVALLEKIIIENHEYIKQLEDASDRQSQQYHQMREKYEKQIDELQKENYNLKTDYSED